MTAKSRGVAAGTGGPLTNAARTWNHFWFAPADPTTLAVIRILCGVLTLYVHLAYSYDLHDFFGRNAWYSLEQANLERREAPRFGQPSDWYGVTPSLPQVPDPEGRSNFVQWLRQVVDDPNPATLPQVIRMLEDLQTEPEAWGAHLPPGFVLGMPPGHGRYVVAKFLRELPPDQAKRTFILDYVERWGGDPRQLDGIGTSSWSIWYHVTDPGWMVFTHCLILLVMLLFTIGFCTRITAALTLQAALSYVQRSPVTFFGGDTMMIILLIYLTIGPSGAALSVDRLLARWWAARRARQAGLPEPVQERPQPMISANFALRLIQIHFCIIYFAAGTSKLLGGAWWNGQAIYYTMANYEFAPLHHDYYLWMMRSLAQHRWLWEIVMAGGTYFTLLLELSLPFLVWNRRLRPYYVTGAFALHTAIAIFMGLVTFSMLMAAMVLAFVPGETMRWLLGWRKVEPAAEDEAVASATGEEPEAEPKASTHVKSKETSRREKEIKS